MYLNIEVEVYDEDGTQMVYLSHNGSSGCKYPFTTREELTNIIKEYVDDAVYYEYEYEEEEADE